MPPPVQQISALRDMILRALEVVIRNDLAQVRQHGEVVWRCTNRPDPAGRGAESPVLGGVLGVQTGINPPARQGMGCV